MVKGICYPSNVSNCIQLSLGGGTELQSKQMVVIINISCSSYKHTRIADNDHFVYERITRVQNVAESPIWFQTSLPQFAALLYVRITCPCLPVCVQYPDEYVVGTHFYGQNNGEKDIYLEY